MKTLLFVLAVLLAALFALMVMRALARQRNEESDWPFVAQTPLSHIEQILYFRLMRTLPDQIVLAQVPLPRFLRVKKGRTWREWHERINQKTIDFLICDRDFGIVAAIELDDRSHGGAGRIDVDVSKNRALAAAQIPLIRWRATALPDAETIRSVVAEIHRDRFGDVGLLTPARTDGRIDASNDATMFNQEIQQ